jgi:hypothetical protein
MFFSIIPSLQIYTIARRADHPPSGKPWLGGVMAHLLGQCVKRGNMIAQPSQPPKMGVMQIQTHLCSVRHHLDPMKSQSYPSKVEIAMA